MSNLLKASITDVPLLSHYLRHSEFAAEDCVYDQDARAYRLVLSRICYERGEKGRSRLFLPVVRYPRVVSRLTISDVGAAEELWVDDRYNIRDYVLNLDAIEQDEPGRLLIVNEYLTISLSISAVSELTLQDVAFPDAITPVTDYSRELDLFPHMEEVNRLRQQ